MNGYLMQELAFHAGDHAFVESYAAEGRFGVVFEDDGETGYFYAVAKDLEGEGYVILDALHIYEASDDEGGEDDEDDVAGSGGEGRDEDESDGGGMGLDESGGGVAADEDDSSDPGEDGGNGAGDEAADDDGGAASMLQIVWSKDWKKCALVIDGYCQAVFDFEAKEGYNINEFPPANQIWSKGERTLTDEIVQKIFSTGTV